MLPVRFYNEDFVRNGFNGVAAWTEPASGFRPPANQFRLLNVKQGYHSHTATANIPQLAQISLDNNTQRVWMNASRAAAMGINDGDSVELSSRLGTFRGQVNVTEKIHPEALAFPGVYGTRSPYFEVSARVGGVNPNDLVPFQMEPISGHAMLQEVWVSVRRV